MSGLQINHGNPWWLSPDVWVVPSDNPSDPSPGTLAPVVGQPYFATANVNNPTSATVQNATVYFYWANPSLGVITSVNAMPIGSSSVTVNAGQTTNTLSLGTWVPSFINGGHECVIAAVVPPGGQPPTVLDGANNPAVAQHNLGVVQTGAQMQHRFHYAFQVCNTARVKRAFSIHAHEAPLAHAEPFLKRHPEHRKALAHPGKIETLGFLHSACPDPSEFPHALPHLNEIHIEPMSCTGFSLVGTLHGGAAFIHVTQVIDEKIVGGLSVLVLTQGESSDARHS